MCNDENTKKNSIVPVVVLIVAVVSFILGFFAGVTVTKKILDLKSKSASFDADEYVRSLNLD